MAASAARDSDLGRPRRSALVQERSRQTRQRLVRAALDLWTERGFEDAVESTTVDEIARAAGVTKGTFYFHFAHKEDILLEVGWGMSGVMNKEALAGVGRELALEAALDELIVWAARRLSETPRAAVARTIEEFYRRRPRARVVPPGDRGSFAAAYLIVFSHAQATGDLPEPVDAGALADMMQTLTMGAIHQWIQDDDADLLALLRYAAAVLVSGARDISARASVVSDGEVAVNSYSAW